MSGEAPALEIARERATTPGLAVAELAVAAVLLTPSVRQWCYAAGLAWPYLVALAFVVALLGVPVVRAWALWRGVLDRPSGRKIHAVPTPLLGGAAVYVAFAFTVLTNFSFSRPLKGVAVGASLVVALGIIDDVFDLPAPVKLAGQIVAAAAAIAYDVSLHVVPMAWPASGPANLVLTLLFLVAVTNALQFLDGMDGLAAGLGAIAGIFFSVSALQTNQIYLMYLSAALVGACLGFLPYNFRPGGARIFLGDSGASFIGFTLAGLAVMGEWAENNPVVALFTPTLILGVPLFDIAFVSVARVLQGKVHSVREWLAYVGRDHIHHRFEAMGFSKRESVLLIFFISSVLGLSAMLLEHATPREAILVLLQAACVLALVALLEGIGRGRTG
ncbi:MAG: undecaprenyl/decaprenyl-phosphate alpha-N-acetylglucosaminyl 1-phosphate transferase [Candidatus Rokubacteria bacterium]|nr:undecaprenyl/decaprenyl-phosphate alpha-N-acetylglucosaminyl 1-phosphate transferase [Candidatus Rokubacteria bacterium]MBI3827531.1 undecaprenyl/decaprenyl-phosphate alpha-N-acetylglucosaminyl 1-phosphate transferase [Candidatus Rokubacteria bacterium]